MDLSKLKFLVAEPDEASRGQIETVLKKMGVIRVDKAVDGREAFAKIKRTYTENLPYSVVVLAWSLPEMSGVEVLRQIREDPKMKSASVLLITPKADAEDLKLVAILKPQGLLVKPLTDDTLEKKLLALLSKN